MTRYIVEVGQTRVEMEAANEAAAIRQFLWDNNCAGLLTPAPESHYKGWKRLELSIGFNVCEDCCEPSPEAEVCEQCLAERAEDADHGCLEPWKHKHGLSIEED